MLKSFLVKTFLKKEASSWFYGANKTQLDDIVKALLAAWKSSSSLYVKALEENIKSKDSFDHRIYSYLLARKNSEVILSETLQALLVEYEGCVDSEEVKPKLVKWWKKRSYGPTSQGQFLTEALAVDLGHKPHEERNEPPNDLRILLAECYWSEAQIKNFLEEWKQQVEPRNKDAFEAYLKSELKKIKLLL